MPCVGVGPEVVPPLQDVHSTARTSTTVALSQARCQEHRPKFQTIRATKHQAKNAASSHNGGLGGADCGKTSGRENVRAVVVIMTVAVAAFEPSRVTVEGETVHVAVAGAPVQLQVTI